jgi:hypothetical protein
MNDRVSIAAAQHSVHPIPDNVRRGRGGGTAARRDGVRTPFGQSGSFAWLEAGSGKMAFSRPAHQRVTHTVRWLHQ